MGSALGLVVRRYVFSRKRDRLMATIGLCAGLGIALGVGTLVVVLSVMNGFRAEFMNKILSLNGHLTVHSFSKQLDLALIPDLQAVSHVRTVRPVLETQGAILGGSNLYGVCMRAWKPEDFKNHTAFQGIALDALKEPNTVFVGKRLAKTMGLQVGDAVDVLLAKTTASAFGMVPETVGLVVAGTFETHLSECDGGLMIASWKTMQGVLELSDAQATCFETVLDDSRYTKTASTRIASLLQNQGTVTDWRAANALFLNVLQTERNVATLVLLLIVLVAAFNIVSTLSILVRNKTQDIAVLKTLGATPFLIQRIFLSIGLIVGGGGTAVGCGLGVLCARHVDRLRTLLERLTGASLLDGDVYILSYLPSKTEVGDVVAIASVSLGLTLVASFFPARQASRLNPTEALQIS